MILKKFEKSQMYVISDIFATVALVVDWAPEWLTQVKSMKFWRCNLSILLFVNLLERSEELAWKGSCVNVPGRIEFWLRVGHWEERKIALTGEKHLGWPRVLEPGNINR